MKKLIAILMAAMMLAALFAGCAKDNADADQPGNGQVNNDQPSNDQPAQDQPAPSVPDQPQAPVVPELTKEEKQTKINDIVTKLMEYEVMMPASMALDASLINDIYQLPEETYEACAVQMPMMMVHATEFALFWAAEGQLDTILEKIEARQDTLMATWEHYLPDQYELVQNYKVLVNGDLVFFLVSNDSDNIAKTVAELMGEGTEYKTAA